MLRWKIEDTLLDSKHGDSLPEGECAELLGRLHSVNAYENPTHAEVDIAEAATAIETLTRELTEARERNIELDDLALTATRNMCLVNEKCASLRAELTDTKARLAEAVGCISIIAEMVNKGNIYDQMCCNGADCGCRGSTHADYLVRCASAFLTKQGMKPSRTAEVVMFSDHRESIHD